MKTLECRKWFFIPAVICTLLLIVASFYDLAISNNIINYGSLFGTIFQIFGKFPAYFVFIIGGQIAMLYAVKLRGYTVFSIIIFITGLAMSFVITKIFINHTYKYLEAAITNSKDGIPIGLSDNDLKILELPLLPSLLITIIAFSIITVILQLLLRKKSSSDVGKYLLIAVFAMAAVFIAVGANVVIKHFWGRFRPYELSASQSEFTAWFHPNGSNGHKSFPSGHAMASVIFILFSWFFTGSTRKILCVIGILFGGFMCISRLIVGAHFLSDVTFSYLITIVIIFIIAELYNYFVPSYYKLDNKRRYLKH